MKKLSIFAFLLLSIFSFGQEESELKEFKNLELGFNATSFIQNIIPFSDLSGEENNFSTIFIKAGNGRTYFRSGLLFDLESEKNEVEKTTESLIGLKFGVEKKVWISKSWAYHFGGDLFGSIENSKTKSIDGVFGSSEFSSKTEDFGLAGVFGLQWFLNEKLALSTESYFLASSARTKAKSFGTTITDETETRIKFVTPTSIYFSVYF